jgi:hypothetical protein
MEYLVYCETNSSNEKDKENKENDKNNEQFVMNFYAIDKAIQFIQLCTLYEMIYKIYSVKNGRKKLNSTYMYLPLQPIKNSGINQNSKKSWQSLEFSYDNIDKNLIF